MAIAYVQSRSVQGNGVVSIALAYSSNVTAGSLLVVGGSNWGRTFGTGSCTDDRLQTYTRDITASNGSPTGAIYSSPNAAAGATTVTLTATGTTDDISIAIHEYSGIATASPADKTASGTGTANDPVSGTTATTAQANELLFVTATHGGATGTPTAGASYTLRAALGNVSDMPIATEDRIVSATGTYSGGFTWNTGAGAYVALIATYKEASGGGGRTLFYRAGLDGHSTSGPGQFNPSLN